MNTGTGTGVASQALATQIITSAEVRPANMEFTLMYRDLKKRLVDQYDGLCMLFDAIGHLDKLQSLTKSDKIKEAICKLK